MNYTLKHTRIPGFTSRKSRNSMTIELKDEHTNNTFQVNGHKIKLFHKGPVPPAGDMETISLMEPAPPDDTP
ncbi:hypothetical protein CR513_49716, partial [Mucuna pruriens]